MPVVREPQAGFLGVNLRRDPLGMTDGDVVRAINADFHAQPGTFRRRLGRVQQGRTAFGTPIQLIGRHNAVRYVIGEGTLFEGANGVLIGLTGLVSTLCAYQPFNDNATWTFVANAGLSFLRKVSGGVVQRWGIDAPGAAPALAIGAAGSLTGAYGAVYTYVRLSGTAIAHESTASPLPTALALTADQLTVAVVASTDPQVTAIRLYRTVANGARYFFDQQVPNATATLVSTQADLSLGTEVELDNTPPPVCGWAVPFQQHIFLCNQGTTPNALFYSKRFRPESFPTDQYLLLGVPSDPLQCAVPMSGMLGVFSRDTKYRVFGNATSGFTALEALSTRGTLAPMATLASSGGVLFVARDGLWSTNFVERDFELTQALAPLFYGETINGYAPIDLGHPEKMAVAEYRRRVYFAYADTSGTAMLAVYSQDTQRWYHYAMPAEAIYWDERPDQLLCGGGDAFLYQAEAGTNDQDQDISLEVRLAVGSMQDRFTLKHFRYLRTDIATAGDPVAVDIYVDTVLRTTVTITGERDRRLRRLPPALLGSAWQVGIRSTGKAAVTVYAVDLLARPLEYA